MCNLHWDMEWPYEQKLTFITDLALRHLAQTNSLAGREVTALLEAGDFDGLCRYELRYGENEDLTSLIHLRQALGLFKKTTIPLPGLDVDREARAYQKFVQSEDLCRVTNQCFKEWSNGRFQFRPFVEGVLHASARKIDHILGEVPSMSDLRFVFGPGATTTVEKRSSHPRVKLSAGLQCSPSLLPHVHELLEEIPGMWRALNDSEEKEKESVCVEVQHGRLGFVPKTVLVDRGIVTEPSLNVMFQGGLGRYLAKRLREVGGVDIREQKPNQRLAREGSITGGLATVDLSSASDTISLELIRHLVPDPWFELLHRARSGCVTYKGKSVVLEKFSSMGNGYTFPLQTILFLSLAISTCEALRIKGVVRVYGDDIILPSEATPVFLGVLHDLGFIPNPDKSFWTGSFRESCGADYYKGIDIRPAYIDDISWPHLFVLYNYYRGELQDDMADWVLNWIPEPLRLWGPPDYGDGHLHTEKWVGKPVHRSKGYGGYTFETYQFVNAKLKRRMPGDYLFPAYSVYASGSEHDDDSPSDVAAFLRCDRVDLAILGESSKRSVLRFRTDRIRPDPQRWSRKYREWQWDSVVPGRGLDRASGFSYKVVSIYTLIPPTL